MAFSDAVVLLLPTLWLEVLRVAQLPWAVRRVWVIANSNIMNKSRYVT
jgi:hypothetical protein